MSWIITCHTNAYGEAPKWMEDVGCPAINVSEACEQEMLSAMAVSDGGHFLEDTKLLELLLWYDRV